MAQKHTSKTTDPVLNDQGGRLMQLDPTDSVNASREEVIRRKAYELYEMRGRINGHDLEDWFSAEEQIA